MGRGFAGWFVVAGLLALGATTSAVTGAYAEFPPEGAVSEPNNPSIATGDLPDPSHKGTLRHYIFYFDCGKRDWIGVSVAGTTASPTSPPQAVGLGREFPPGPPPGSKTIGGSPNRAMAPSGQTFVLEGSNWFDVRTNTPVRSPRLCPGTNIRPGQRQADPVTSAHSQGSTDAGGDELPPVQSTRPNDQPPDQLPPPPTFKSRP